MNHLDIIRQTNAKLQEQFREKLKINPDLNRMLVSFQANKKLPGYRWFKYKEGFSYPLIRYIFEQVKISSGTVLDPFAGSGTTLFAAGEFGCHAVGIELLPLACEIIQVRRDLLNQDLSGVREVIQRWQNQENWADEPQPKPFPHLKITSGAFPEETERFLSQYLAALEKETSPLIKRLLRFAALCVLEDISYTRKDGQYLRWDYRAGRRQAKKQFNKGTIESFKRAIAQKLEEIWTDITCQNSPRQVDSTNIDIYQGSCLTLLPKFAAQTVDCILTSPPYCNRYDYTRTYALELALLGLNEGEVRHLRQELLSCTVENREKPELKSNFAGVYSRAAAAFDSQEALQAILKYLEHQKAEKALNNSGIVRMVRYYFFEMSLLIFECARLLKPGAPFILVNDNVRYQGATIPVDLILSDIARQAGFEVEAIWVLPASKGNSSQQMGEHGREELRKCVYIWRRAAQ